MPCIMESLWAASVNFLSLHFIIKVLSITVCIIPCLLGRPSLPTTHPVSLLLKAQSRTQAFIPEPFKHSYIGYFSELNVFKGFSARQLLVILSQKYESNLEHQGHTGNMVFVDFGSSDILVGTMHLEF